MASRLAREKRTLAAMTALWCRAHHGSRSGLCPACRELLTYAEARLDRCVFREAKPTCAKCPIHCYQPEMRERMRGLMRWAGPRMTWRHPWLALRHLLDARSRVPSLPGRCDRPPA